MKDKIVSAKNFVVKNKTKILVTALIVTATIAAGERYGLHQHDKFLKEHDLYDTYWADDESYE